MFKFIYIQIFMLLAISITSCNKKPGNSENPGGPETFPNVGAIHTKLELSPSVPSASINEEVIFTATLIPDQNLNTRPPKGAVTFTVNGENVSGCQSVPLNSLSTAQCTTKFATGGEFEIGASYGGDETVYDPSSTSLIPPYTVHKVPTFLKVTSQTPDAIDVGSTLTFNVQLSHEGNIDFVPGKPKSLQIADQLNENTPEIKENKCTPLTPVEESKVYSSTCTYQVMNAGTHHLRVIYPEDPTNAETSTTPFVLSVSTIKPVLNIISIIPDKDKINQIAITAELYNPQNALKMEGTLTFSVKPPAASQIICTKNVSISETGTQTFVCSPYTIEVKDYYKAFQFSASFSPANPNYFESPTFTAPDFTLGDSLRYTPNFSFSYVSPHPNSDKVFVGDTVVLKATLGNNPVDTSESTVTFTLDGDNDHPLCTKVKFSDNVATCSYTTVNPGTTNHLFTATFNADRYYNSVRENITLNFLKYTPQITLIPILLTPGSLDFEVKAVLGSKPDEGSDSVPSPSGTVTFTLDNKSIPDCGEKTLIEGSAGTSSATCNFTAYETNHTIQVEYKPDSKSFYLAENASIPLSLEGLIPKPHISIAIPAAQEQNPGQKEAVYQGYQTAQWQDGMLQFNLSGKWFNEDVADIWNQLEMSIDSETILEDYNLEKSSETPYKFEAPDQKPICRPPQLKDGVVYVSCHNFYPMVPKFRLNFILSYNRYTGKKERTEDYLNITMITVSKENMEKSVNHDDARAPAEGCGLYGNTTRQFMFDCSMKVADSHGRVKYTGLNGDIETRSGYVFDPGYGDVSEQWFLVHCPANSPAYKCSWLSPVLTSTNPIMEGGQYISFDPNNSSDSARMSLFTGKRILWSGMFDNKFGFWDVNTDVAFNFEGTPYAFYTGRRQWKNKQTDPYTDLCQKNENPDIVPNLSFYTWRVPSFSQLMTLTGATSCNTAGGEQYPARCLDVWRPGTPPLEYGFSATIVPGFYRKDVQSLWSSSSSYSPAGLGDWSWSFINITGEMTTSQRRYKDEAGGFGVRCASMDW